MEGLFGESVFFAFPRQLYGAKLQRRQHQSLSARWLKSKIEANPKTPINIIGDFYRLSVARKQNPSGSRLIEAPADTHVNQRSPCLDCFAALRCIILGGSPCIGLHFTLAMKIPALAAAALIASASSVDAFAPSPKVTSVVTVAPALSVDAPRDGSVPFSTRLYMTDDDDDLDDLFGEDDDALSALIGKRDKIYKSTPKTDKPKPPSTDEEIDAKLDEIEAKVADFDYMDDLPEFTSKRPVRTPKKVEKKEEKDDSAPDDEISFIDYQADYDDENDFHIPNRMGFGTGAWGEVKMGFKEGKKLKKKEMKAGRYLAGDLQVSAKNAFVLLLEIDTICATYLTIGIPT